MAVCIMRFTILVFYIVVKLDALLLCSLKSGLYLLRVVEAIVYQYTDF